MKYKVYVICFFSILILNSLLTAGDKGPVNYIPEKPEAGKEVVIKFNSEGTELEHADSVKVIIYWEDVDTLYCDEYLMAKSGDDWECKYNVPGSAWGAGIKFISGEIEVNNDGVVFPMLLYKEDGSFLKGTRAAYACLCVNGSVSPQTSKSLAYSSFKDEFVDNPELTKYFLVKYFLCCKDEEPDTWQNTAQKILAGIDTPEDLDERALTELQYAYLYLFRDAGKSNEYKSIAIKKYPLGNAAQIEAYDEIKKIDSSNPDELEKAILDFQSKYDRNTSTSYRLWDMLITTYCKNGMYKNLETCLSQNPEILKKISVIHSISEGAKTIVSNGGDLDSAKYFADLGYKFAKEYRPTEVEFRGNTQARIKSILNQFMNSVLFNSAYVYEKNDEPAEALNFIDEAYSDGEPTIEVKAMYAKLLLTLHKDDDKALSITDELISSGRTDAAIIEVNKEAYSVVNGSEKGYEDHYAMLRKPELDKFKDKIKTELTDEPVPDFSLTDLDGNTVTLSELKGKTVILDFWATWCGPCKASMPSMEKVLKKYADDKNVEFLFVDTFERGQNVEENAKKFMDINGYPFHVLIDVDGKVAKDNFGITAIPAKIFIDKKGNLRYKSLGFEGEEALLNEIDSIIELIN